MRVARARRSTSAAVLALVKSVLALLHRAATSEAALATSSHFNVALRNLAGIMFLGFGPLDQVSYTLTHVLLVALLLGVLTLNSTMRRSGDHHLARVKAAVREVGASVDKLRVEMNSRD
jgi:hypothetical protein